jgi:phage terminase large subunit
MLGLDKLPESEWPVSVFGGEKPEWIDYPNGSRIWIAGLDKPGKALSSERDWVYVNQAEELDLEDWETLLTRATGRAGNAPYPQVMADCNPGPPTHWILSRFSPSNPVPGRVFLESRHEDNPTLFDDAGVITERGKLSLSILDGLTGVRYQRLRLGRWVQAEGAVYDGYDAAVHLIDPFQIPAEWKRYRAVDFGYTNPFVTHWWAEDPDGRLYLYRELYGTRRLVDEWAVGRIGEDGEQVYPNNITALSEGESIQANVCDHDAEGRATLESRGIRTTAAYKAVKEGIQFVQARYRVEVDGKPRIFFFRGACVETDPLLVEARKPTCTVDELGSYIWNTSDGRLKGEEPVKENDHGCDAMRYLVAFVDRPRQKGWIL